MGNFLEFIREKLGILLVDSDSNFRPVYNILEDMSQQWNSIKEYIKHEKRTAN